MTGPGWLSRLLPVFLKYLSPTLSLCTLLQQVFGIQTQHASQVIGLLDLAPAETFLAHVPVNQVLPIEIGEGLAQRIGFHDHAEAHTPRLVIHEHRALHTHPLGEPESPGFALRVGRFRKA